MILQNLDENFYVEILSYYEYKQLLKEEVLRPDDIILNGDEYGNFDETRKSLSDNLKPLAAAIRQIDTVKMVNPNPSTSNRGLSAYVNVVFKYPEGITKEERDKYYKYIIRFSDHKDKHPKDCVTYQIDIVGRKVKNLKRAGLAQFQEKLPEIQKVIKDFETKKFGKQITFIQDNSKKESFVKYIKESDDLNESLEEIASGTYCTDYVGDIVNWLLNKPKPYRIVYDRYYDVWCIADAMQNTHKDMSIDMFDSDYLYGVAKT